jgi:colanic acid/amylovoran biosynthesis glycosyltransferase
MKIIVHFKNGPFGMITENWIYNQVSGLKNVSVRFYSIIHKNKKDFPFKNLRSIWDDLSFLPRFLNRGWYKYFGWAPQFYFWLRKDKPALIHAHFGPSGYEILRFAKLLNIPVITSFYGWDAYLLPEEKSIWRGKYKCLFKYGKLFLVEGPAMRRKLISLGCPPEKIIIHHIGIKLEDYKYHKKRVGRRGTVRLLVVGRFIEKKGIPYAIKAFARVKKKINRNIHLTIVGDSDKKGTMTEEKRGILQTIKDCGLSNDISITGYISHNEYKKMSKNHHILISPSVHSGNGDAEGGFPVVLTEMAASGMPILATKHCDIPEIVIDKKNGFLVPERDVDALSEKLEYLIRHPEIWTEMGQAGRKFVEKRYDIKKLNQRLVKIYSALLSNDGRILEELKTC